MKVDPVLISVGANTILDCCDWGNTNKFAVCSNTFISIYDTKKYEIIATLKGHKKRVNCVKWLGPNSLVSASVDKTLIFWELQEKEYSNYNGLGFYGWKITKIIKTDEIVTLLSSMNIGNDNYTLCYSTDKILRVYKNFELLQSFSLTLLAISLKLFYLPFKDQQYPVFCYGGSDRNIHLFTFSETTKKFEKSIILKGHQDWVKTFDFCILQGNKENEDEVFLASAGQDNNVRIWKISKTEEKEDEDEIMFTKPIFFQIDAKNEKYNFKVVYETILKNHDGWINCVKFKQEGIKEYKDLAIVSCSMDRKVIVWSPKKELDNVWSEDVQLGLFSGLTGMFCQMGFFGVYWSSADNYSSIISNSYNGSLHCWKKLENGKWKRHFISTGHNLEVKDIQWSQESKGEPYFLSAGFDKTVRAFGKWKKNQLWYEIGRPQMHGHAMNKICFVSNKEHTYFSGSAEASIRVYTAPTNSLRTFKNLSNIEFQENEKRPIGSYLPSLSLTNKPVYKDVIDRNQENVFQPIVYDTPPLEHDLLQNTLWAEQQRLFGHRYEIVSMDCKQIGENHIAVSSTPSKIREDTEIKVWETTENDDEDEYDDLWEEMKALKTKTLTVTYLKFSPNGKYLIASTRDRCLLGYKITTDEKTKKVQIEEIIHLENAHKKSISGITWSLDSKFFATVSRDKFLRIWTIKEEKLEKVFEIRFKAVCTSIDFIDDHKAVKKSEKYLLAIGFLNGEIIFMNKESEKDEWNKIGEVDPMFSHNDRVNEIQWKVFEENKYRLISCSDDCSVRMFNIAKI